MSFIQNWLRWEPPAALVSEFPFFCALLEVSSDELRWPFESVVPRRFELILLDWVMQSRQRKNGPSPMSEADARKTITENNRGESLSF